MGKLLMIHGVDDVRLDDYQRPCAGASDVVIRMKAVGICGSDLSYIKHGGIPAPGTLTALGHEGAGEVIEVGEAVSGVTPGQRVIVNPMMTPSYIGSGGPEGAFTEELLVRDGIAGVNILPIPEGVSYEVAAMCEPLAVAMHGINRAEAKAGDKLAIFGCGPIGLGMVLWAIDRGCRDVIALDLSDERLERARALGAHTINPRARTCRRASGKSTAQHRSSARKRPTPMPSSTPRAARGSSPTWSRLPRRMPATSSRRPT